MNILVLVLVYINFFEINIAYYKINLYINIYL